MGQILVRNLDDAVIERLKQKAQREKASLEQTARLILTQAAKPSRDEVIAEIDALRKRIGPITGNSTDLIREDRDNDERHR
jgi:antitoxin FitA